MYSAFRLDKFYHMPMVLCEHKFCMFCKDNAL